MKQFKMFIHQEQYYFKTNEVLPGENDGKFVLMYNKDSRQWEQFENQEHWFGLHLDVYTHWMQMPKTPNEAMEW